MDKLRMKTLDAAEGNVAKIAALFPQCVTERLGKDGTAELAIDFDKLRDELSKDLLDGAEERYQFTWPDKRAASRLANESTDKTLRPDLDASVDFWNTENLYIEGDNLDVLKVLRENYLGAIKMIYIDPPYNTGNDFVYNDDFAQSREDFEATSGAFDEDGNQIIDPMQRNTESNGRFHTDWLNMIYPRLKVARDLLSDNGVVFISIDDCEVENLRKVCDEIFGEHNFLAQLTWEKKYTIANDAKYFSSTHDFILCYAKNIDNFVIGKLPRTDEMNAAYKNPDNHPKGPWKATPLHARSGSNADFTYTFKNGVVFTPPSGRFSAYSADKLKELDENNEIWFGKDGMSTPSRKTFLCELKNDGVVPRTIIPFSEGGHNHEADEEVKSLMGGKLFTSPKPTKLLNLLLRIANCDEDSIILDFFSGSATTAHAVMKLNAEDGGKRKFIMVQLPEVTDEKSEARKAGYETICQIGEERIRRAGKKVKEEAGLNGQDLDTGFRVLKLDSSNMEDVFYTPEDFDAQNIFTTVDNVKSDRTPLDLLFQVLPELDIELSAKIEEKEVNGKKVFFVDGNYLIATFDTEVNESTVTEIAKMKPQYFVMRDASAANDNVLDNFEQIFRHYSPETVRKII
ncbi:MAG: site-specific DNA-methyltransferase [Muribaculaceae bacterium]